MNPLEPPLAMAALLELDGDVPARLNDCDRAIINAIRFGRSHGGSLDRS